MLVAAAGVTGYSISRVQTAETVAALKMSQQEELATYQRTFELQQEWSQWAMARMDALMDRADRTTARQDEATEKLERVEQQSRATTLAARAAARAAASDPAISDQRRAALNRVIEDANKALVQ
ncbi:hypothetical protein IMZ29_00685 [Achromobacter sp. GG226]|uniref:hypothetical protein n=1 Tax=Verticiella alkaliphila TaxID=2779529 RepID=UPI001C0BF532|nr:hypothetical protein [Verticiella sp. GG226]MBU4609118.1 hypothetical protein [Verticiella sp. GG226]